MNDIALTSTPEHVPAHLVRTFDYKWAREIETNPWEYYLEHARGADIFWSPLLGGYWVINRADLIEETYRTYELFSNGVVQIPMPPRPQSIPASMDPPEHTKYRKIIAQRMFSPRALATLVEDIDVIGDALMEELAPRGSGEFVAEFTRPLPVSLLLKMLGLPDDIRATLALWVQEMFHGRSVEENLSGYRKAFAFLGEWLDEQLAKGGEAGGIVMPAFLEARVDGRPLTRGEMHSMAMLLLGAGVDTVTSQMTHVMRYFTENPHARQRVLENPGLAPRAVEELMRRYGIAHIARVVRNDMDFHGVQMRKGDLVLCASALAGLDEKTFPRPMEVDFERPNWKAHTPFGSGSHICPGAFLARTVLKSLVTRFMPRLPDLRIASGADLRHVAGITVSLTNLPLEWTPTPPARASKAH